jgi:hypothetical protein
VLQLPWQFEALLAPSTTVAAAPALSPSPAAHRRHARDRQRKIDRGRGCFTALAPELCEDGGEGRVAVIAHQEANRQDRLAAAAIQLKPTVR